MKALPGLPLSGSGLPFPATAPAHPRRRERARALKMHATRMLSKQSSADPANASKRAAFLALRRLPLQAFVMQTNPELKLLQALAASVKASERRAPPAAMKPRENVAPKRKTHRQKRRDAERAAKAAIIAAETEAERLDALVAWQKLTQLGGNEIGRIVAPKIGAFIMAICGAVTLEDRIERRVAARVAKANKAAGAGKAAAR